MQRNSLSQYRDQKHNHLHTILITRALWKMETITIVINRYFPKYVGKCWGVSFVFLHIISNKVSSVDLNVYETSFHQNLTDHTQVLRSISIYRIDIWFAFNIAYENLLISNISWHEKSNFACKYCQNSKSFRFAKGLFNSIKISN